MRYRRFKRSIFALSAQLPAAALVLQSVLDVTAVVHNVNCMLRRC